MNTPARRALITVSGVLAWRLASELISEHRRLERLHDHADDRVGRAMPPPTAAVTAHAAGRATSTNSRRSVVDRHGMRAARKARLEAADTRLRESRTKRAGEADAGPMWPWLALSMVGVVGTLVALTNPLGDLSWVLAVGGVVLALVAWFLSRPPAAAESPAKQRKDRTRA